MTIYRDKFLERDFAESKPFLAILGYNFVRELSYGDVGQADAHFRQKVLRNAFAAWKSDQSVNTEQIYQY